MTGLLDMGTVSLWAALLAGLAGSGHCLAMCGGVAGALAMRSNATGASHRSRLALAVAYNVARIASYTLAGAIAGLLGDALLRTVDVAPLSIALRVLAGGIMIAAAGRLMFGWRLLDPLEAAGSRMWRRILPRVGAGAQRAGIGGAVSLGLAWGCLPCGLSYSMLLLAATTANVLAGALVMAAFGFGTLPAMLTATVAFERAARALTAKATLRGTAGTLLLAFGAWTAGSAVYHGIAHADHAGHGEHAGHSMASPAMCGPSSGDGAARGAQVPGR